MPKPTFFIVTPSFNQAEFIEQTIDSILSQKGDFEVIYWVMDGGSTDQTPKILDKYRSKINFISKKDKGQSNAINKGVTELLAADLDLDNTIFAYINSDDYYLPGAFERVAHNLLNADQDWLSGDAIIVNQNNQPIQQLIRLYKRFLRKLISRWPSLIYVFNPYAQPATFIRGTLVKKLGKFSENYDYVMDYDYWLRAYQEAGLPMVLDLPLATFRIHSLSKGKGGFQTQFDEQLLATKKYTQNPLLIWLQMGHNLMTTLIYRIIKS